MIRATKPPRASRGHRAATDADPEMGSARVEQAARDALREQARQPSAAFAYMPPTQQNAHGPPAAAGSD